MSRRVFDGRARGVDARALRLGRREALGALGLLAGGARALAGCVNLDSFFYNPRPRSTPYALTYPDGWPQDRRVPMELTDRLELPSPGSTSVFAVFARRPADEFATAPTVLYHHGNADNIDTYWPRASHIWSLGANVLIYDYPGYGLTPGHPSEPEVYRAAHAALAFVRGMGAAIDQARVFNYGYSLGGAPACELASSAGRFAGLVTESTFTSVAGLAADASLVVPRSFVMTNVFDNRSKIRAAAANARFGVLLFHGQADDFVQFHFGEQLHAEVGNAVTDVSMLRADRSMLVPVPNANHGDLPSVADAQNGNLYTNTLRALLARTM